jgi:Fe-S-cluster-containing dehydrogenase component
VQRAAVQGAKERTKVMSQKVLLIHLDNCVRCYACEVACREEHGLTFETKSRWCQVMTIEPRWIYDEMHMDFVPVICFQCDDPLCVSLCPVDAISKRNDGIVVVDEEVCTGCKFCIYGCPYGAMFYDEVRGVAGKCDLCTSRIHGGQEPACVQHCIGGALQFLTRKELTTITGEHILRIGMVYYASSKWNLKNRSREFEGHHT